MNQENIEKVKGEIAEILKKSPVLVDPEHSKRTLKWLLVLKPSADLAEQIAALGHDIDRGVSYKTEKDEEDFSNYGKIKDEHSMRSAKIMTGLLKKYEFDPKFIQKVNRLVENHEVGGDEQSDILRDADSIAFFEYNIPFYIKRNGIEKARLKIKYMFDRVSNKAKEIIRNLEYKDAEVGRLVKEIANL